MNDATRELLAVLDPLPYRDRLRHVVAWARNAPDRAQVCAELRDRGPYERHLALVVAMSTGDTDGIRHALGDPLSRLRAVALGAALRSGQLTVLPDGLAAVDRRAVYRRLRGLGRPEIADALIGRVLDRHGRAEAATLLPACSEATIRAMLPLLEHRISLAALARRHPGAVHDRARELLSATEPRYRTALWPRLAQGVLRGGVDSALALLEEFAPEDRLPGRLSAYGRIAVVHPQRVVDLLTAPGRAAWLRRQSLPPNLLRRLAVLPDTALVPLARAFRENARALSRLLAALPPARRGALHDLAVADADTRFQVPQPQVVEVLPAAVRIREARRVLTLASIQENEDLVWEWSAFLPWPEAVAALEPAIGSGDADDRSLGYALLVKAALRGRDPEPVAEVLTRLLRLRNEQDPVRQSALGQLYRAGRLLTAGSAADLTRIVIDVTEARDTSAGTRAALGRLAGAVLQHHAGVPELAEWALFTYERLTAVIVPPLTRMRRGGEVAVFGRLRQWAEAALDRGSPGPLFALAGALGRRGHDLPELQGLLRRCIDPGMLESTARAAIPLLLDDPRTRSARVAEVLALDPTAVAVPIVWHTVSATRTDLLDVVFADRAHGRFVPDGLRWVPSSVRFPERWLPRQQRHLVDLMERVVDDGEVPEHRRAAAL
ncbi:MAG TPA: hypothetical protein VN408_37330, partial [Actinoplanes sp.]|nr:hypothetical protein [Actinoplanes sp.]